MNDREFCNLMLESIELATEKLAKKALHGRHKPDAWQNIYEFVEINKITATLKRKLAEVLPK